jgi:hypothetical protein
MGTRSLPLPGPLATIPRLPGLGVHSEMTMNERQRMQYLEAMGITMFVPRWILPGARMSAQLAVAEPEVERAVEQAAVESAAAPLEVAEIPAAPRPVQAAVSEIMDTLRPRASVETPPVEEPGSTPTPAVVEQPVQFALSIWRPVPALMILDTRHAGQALPTQALLENILRAKEVALPPAKPDILLWPPAGVVPTPGWGAAREMVQAFLQARLERQPARYLWLMGESACHAVLPDHSYQDSLGRAINLDSLATLAVVLPSLADMLLQPELKARTWAAIRSLHVR